MDSVIKKYSELQSSFNYVIVFDEVKKLHSLMKISNLYKIVSNKNVHLHESITEVNNCKLIIDIDSTVNEYKYNRSIWLIVQDIINRLVHQLPMTSINDYLIYESCGGIKNKLSYHIVLNNFYFKSLKHVREVVVGINDYYDLIDYSIYTKRRNIRILHCSKLSEINRTKNLINTDSTIDTFKSSLITYVEGCTFIDIDISEPIVLPIDTNIKFKLSNTIKTFIEDFMQTNNLSIYKEVGNLIRFNNHTGFKCEYHNRIHENQNPYIVINSKNNTITLYCGIEEGKYIIYDVNDTIESNVIGIDNTAMINSSKIIDVLL